MDRWLQTYSVRPKLWWKFASTNNAESPLEDRFMELRAIRNKPAFFLMYEYPVRTWKSAKKEG